MKIPWVIVSFPLANPLLANRIIHARTYRSQSPAQRADWASAAAAFPWVVVRGGVAPLRAGQPQTASIVSTLSPGQLWVGIRWGKHWRWGRLPGKPYRIRHHTNDSGSYERAWEGGPAITHDPTAPPVLSSYLHEDPDTMLAVINGR